MKFEADPDVIQWLESLDISRESFQWDGGNLEKLQKHRVTKEDVEGIFLVPFVLAGRVVEPYHPENRWILFGKSQAGRKLALIFTIREDRIRPISCRSMRKKEVKAYEEALRRRSSH